VPTLLKLDASALVLQFTFSVQGKGMNSSFQRALRPMKISIIPPIYSSWRQNCWF